MIISNWKPVENSSLQGTFDVTIDLPPHWGGFVIKAMCYFKKDKKRWVSFPCTTYEKNGQKCWKFYNTFTLPKTLNSFHAKVLEELDKHLKDLLNV